MAELEDDFLSKTVNTFVTLREKKNEGKQIFKNVTELKG